MRFALFLAVSAALAVQADSKKRKCLYKDPAKCENKACLRDCFDPYFADSTKTTNMNDIAHCQILLKYKKCLKHCPEGIEKKGTTWMDAKSFDKRKYDTLKKKMENTKDENMKKAIKEQMAKTDWKRCNPVYN